MKSLQQPSIIAAIALLRGLLSPGESSAAAIEVTVVDRDARPVADVAVYWRPPAGGERMAAPETTAVMDQVRTRFEPHLLVVQTGTSVEFPNSDTIAHHVYSFSHPNQFMLPIYKGHAHPPVTFSERGTVILGCNIHDNMLGYILVVDSAAFSKTDGDGKARITGVGNGGDIVIWSPRFRDEPEALASAVDPAISGGAPISFRLEKTLRPPFDEKTSALSWSDY